MSSLLKIGLLVCFVVTQKKYLGNAPKSHLRDLRLARARGREVRRLPERSMLSILVGGGKILY